MTSRDADIRRHQARIRRAAAWALVLAPSALILAADVILTRAASLRAGGDVAVAYVESVPLGLALWTSFMVAATARRGPFRWFARAVLAALVFLAVGAQLYAFGRYHTFLSTTSMLVGTSMLPSIRQELWFDGGSFLRAIVPPAVIVTLLVVLARRLARPRLRARRRAEVVAAASLSLALLVLPDVKDVEIAPFDLLYVHGMGVLARAWHQGNDRIVRANPGPRSPLPVPKLTAKPAKPRDVVLLLNESVRASSACVAYDPTCKLTPFSNAAARDRIPLTEMRTVDSTTAISLSVLWSGIDPMSSRAELHAAPLVWEYANAAGLDTAYWTSQNLLFSNAGTWLQSVAFGHHINATELEPDAPLLTGADDGALVNYVDEHLADLKEPFFAVVHLSNTHAPFKVDDHDTPFLPQSPRSGTDHKEELANRYADAIYHQDRAVARFLDALRASPAGPRTVVVYLSDHGEQFYEHGILGHTATLYEQEVHVPAWIDAPPGTLGPDEDKALRALSTTPLTTMDVLPTLLDLVGILDDPGVAPFEHTFVGRSLLRGGSPTDKAVPMTNCSELWTCAFKNWGAIQGSRKVLATQADHAWLCYDLAADPDEAHDLGPDGPGCAPLEALAERTMHGRPF